jgi:hypothetical protein
MGRVVHQEDFVHNIKGDVLKGPLQGAGGIVGGHDHQHFLSCQQFLSPSLSLCYIIKGKFIPKFVQELPGKSNSPEPVSGLRNLGDNP